MLFKEKGLKKRNILKYYFFVCILSKFAFIIPSALFPLKKKLTIGGKYQ